METQIPASIVPTSTLSSPTLSSPRLSSSSATPQQPHSLKDILDQLLTSQLNPSDAYTQIQNIISVSSIKTLKQQIKLEATFTLFKPSFENDKNLTFLINCFSNKKSLTEVDALRIIANKSGCFLLPQFFLARITKDEDRPTDSNKIISHFMDVFTYILTGQGPIEKDITESKHVSRLGSFEDMIKLLKEERSSPELPLQTLPEIQQALFDPSTSFTQAIRIFKTHQKVPFQQLTKDHVRMAFNIVVKNGSLEAWLHSPDFTSEEDSKTLKNVPGLRFTVNINGQTLFNPFSIDPATLDELELRSIDRTVQDLSPLIKYETKNTTHIVISGNGKKLTPIESTEYKYIEKIESVISNLKSELSSLGSFFDSLMISSPEDTPHIKKIIISLSEDDSLETHIRDKFKQLNDLIDSIQKLPPLEHLKVDDTVTKDFLTHLLTIDIQIPKKTQEHLKKEKKLHSNPIDYIKKMNKSIESIKIIIDAKKGKSINLQHLTDLPEDLRKLQERNTLLKQCRSNAHFFNEDGQIRRSSEQVQLLKLLNTTYRTTSTPSQSAGTKEPTLPQYAGAKESLPPFKREETPLTSALRDASNVASRSKSYSPSKDASEYPRKAVSAGNSPAKDDANSFLRKNIGNQQILLKLNRKLFDDPEKENDPHGSSTI
tara:strand:- start:728 stop:2701 length:1974 start_codon:yes stop_codon:yes gene_type:complete